MSEICQHPAQSQIIDEHEGSIICTQCARVLGANYQDIPTPPGDDNQCATTGSDYIDIIVDRNNICQAISRKAYEMRAIIREKLPKRSALHLALYSIYQASNAVDTPYTLEEIASMGFISLKVMNRINNSISKSTNYIVHHESKYNPASYLGRFAETALSAREIADIEKLLKETPSRLQSKSLKLLVLGTAYYYISHVRYGNDAEARLKPVCQLLKLKWRNVREFSRQLRALRYDANKNAYCVMPANLPLQNGSISLCQSGNAYR